MIVGREAVEFAKKHGLPVHVQDTGEHEISYAYCSASEVTDVQVADGAISVDDRTVDEWTYSSQSLDVLKERLEAAESAGFIHLHHPNHPCWGDPPDPLPEGLVWGQRAYGGSTGVPRVAVFSWDEERLLVYRYGIVPCDPRGWFITNR